MHGLATVAGHHMDGRAAVVRPHLDCPQHSHLQWHHTRCKGCGIAAVSLQREVKHRLWQQHLPLNGPQLIAGQQVCHHRGSKVLSMQHALPVDACNQPARHHPCQTILRRPLYTAHAGGGLVGLFLVSLLLRRLFRRAGLGCS